MTHQTITFTTNEIENIQEMTDVNMHQTAAATVLFKLAKDGTTVTQDFAKSLRGRLHQLKMDSEDECPNFVENQKAFVRDFKDTVSKTVTNWEQVWAAL